MVKSLVELLSVALHQPPVLRSDRVGVDSKIGFNGDAKVHSNGELSNLKC